MEPRPDPLREVKIVEQRDPALRRRWFENDYFDLFTWQDTKGAVTRFQLCYDVEHNERALAWSAAEGIHHPLDSVAQDERSSHRPGLIARGAAVPGRRHAGAQRAA